MSKSRNPKVFELFTRMDLVEKVGSGIPRMTDLMKEAGFPAPEYRTEGFFTTILYKNKKTVKETGNLVIFFLGYFRAPCKEPSYNKSNCNHYSGKNKKVAPGNRLAE